MAETKVASRRRRRLPALKVHQWLPGWNKVDFSVEEHRARPPEFFYLLSVPARELKSLSGIVRRQAKNAASRSADLGIQRQHDPERSEEIGRFVEFGFPWSTLSDAKRKSAEFNDLRKPGWLPTAVVLNVLTEGSTRNGVTVDSGDLVRVQQEGDQCAFELPYVDWTSSWHPKALHPFEVIDGQHRLWAFEGASAYENFELPVVAFVGLDISWQAYLFWTINIKPKRINSSLAFDLYPLLRSEDWLDRAEGHAIYRDTRAQELTEILWSYPDSPWYDRINMLGERQNIWVSQSAWIKSLTATFVRSWDPRSSGTGGLFGGRSTRDGEVLGWSRAQQAAFLIYSWRELRKSVAKTRDPWAQTIRAIPVPAESAASRPEGLKPNDDLAFYGPYSLLNTDQGVRGFLQVLNDLCYLRASQLKLNSWTPAERVDPNPLGSVEDSLKSLAKQPFSNYLTDMCERIAHFDWRTSSTPNLTDQQRRAKLVFRGSSGYKELRSQLLEFLAAGDGEVGEAAKRLLDAN